MDKVFVVILLVTGICDPTETNSYYLVKHPSTWHEASSFCGDVDMTLIQRDDVLYSSWANSSYSKAWIGLISVPTSWIQLDKKIASYFNWSLDQPDNTTAELCVTVTDVGDWYNRNCTELKQSVCSNGSHFSIETEMNWEDAVMNCEAENTTLVEIPDSNTNAQIRNLLSNNTEVWLGLHRNVEWTWSATGEISKSPNWEQPINSSAGNELCAAMLLQDGKLIQEACNTLNPFICASVTTGTWISYSANSHASIVKQSKKVVVKLKIRTTANLEDPKVSAELKQQLQAMVANKGVAKFKLAWKKLPGNL